MTSGGAAALEPEAQRHITAVIQRQQTASAARPETAAPAASLTQAFPAIQLPANPFSFHLVTIIVEIVGGTLGGLTSLGCLVCCICLCVAAVAGG